MQVPSVKHEPPAVVFSRTPAQTGQFVVQNELTSHGNEDGDFGGVAFTCAPHPACLDCGSARANYCVYVDGFENFKKGVSFCCWPTDAHGYSSSTGDKLISF